MKDKNNRKLKDSGIEWIGEMPKEWEVARIGSVYKLRNEKVSDYDYMPLSVTMNGVVPQLDTAAKTNAHEDRKLVLKGDFAINSRSDRRGSCGISDYNGSVSLINTVITPIENMSSRYYNWIFHTEQFADEFYKWGHGIVDDLWTTSWQEMKNINIIIPSIEEQKRIADFLDNKCFKIDKIINDINKQIETLANYKKSLINDLVTGKKVLVGANSPVDYLQLSVPEKTKDSGIEWIGKVPSDWKFSKVKYGFFRKNSKAFEENPTILSLARDGVKIRDISTNEGQIAESYYEYNPVTIDDLLLNPMDIQSGANCSISKVEGVISPAYMNLRFKKGFNPHYYDYYFKLCYWNYIFFSYGKGVSFDNRWTLNDNTIMNFLIIQPSIEEQKRIADFLDEKCSKIDKIISDKKQQIESLEKYKKSLIFEYVTGKKQV